ncbi:MAG: NAD-dependent epimerase/dehydratase family protein [Planctomycetales bacterium]|nr:NAD-dependent epimerase/dehydratase family protein [Planctomycetales bacterium]
MAEILLTGHGGFLGSEIARQLIASGHRVRGLARGHYPELERMGVQGIQGSVVDRTTVLSAAQGCDAIVHTAAKAGVWGSWADYYGINTVATSHLLEAAVSGGVQAFVYTSSPSVTFAGSHQSGVDERVPYPEKWLCFYPQTKALAERSVLDIARHGRLRTCALRPHLIWGDGDPHLFPRVIQRALSGKLRRVGSGENLIDVVHVKQAAGAHVAAVEKLLAGDNSLNGQALFLTDGNPIQCWQWITRILQAADVAVPKRSISFRAAYRIGAILEAAYWTARIEREPPMTRFVAAQLALDHYFSIERAKQLLNYRPMVDVERELEKCKPWLRRLAASFK